MGERINIRTSAATASRYVGQICPQKDNAEPEPLFFTLKTTAADLIDSSISAAVRKYIIGTKNTATGRSNALESPPLVFQPPPA